MFVGTPNQVADKRLEHLGDFHAMIVGILRQREVVLLADPLGNKLRARTILAVPPIPGPALGWRLCRCLRHLCSIHLSH